MSFQSSNLFNLNLFGFKCFVLENKVVEMIYSSTLDNLIKGGSFSKVFWHAKISVVLGKLSVSGWNLKKISGRNLIYPRKSRI